jgi:hypothetical protein
MTTRSVFGQQIADELATPAAQAGPPWLRHHAWPLWLDYGADWRHRAFHENLDAASLQCAALHRSANSKREAAANFNSGSVGTPIAAAAASWR